MPDISFYKFSLKESKMCDKEAGSESCKDGIAIKYCREISGREIMTVNPVPEKWAMFYANNVQDSPKGKGEEE
ncbi:hypothetical protein DRJ25_03845 [Candidatus Woesearchaeota archaeon]|nr:MAG: hypothetical protein DRJ25_03845 [Candidatus Woesearchaeota archaeon]